MEPTFGRRLCAAALTAAALAYAAAPDPAAAVPLSAGTTAILSGTDSLFEALPTPVGEADISAEAISRDGRYVAFTSSSDGLSDADDDDVTNVYLKDVVTGAVELVSRASGANGAPADRDCGGAAISDDGRTVAFTCEGSLDPDDRNGASDVYARSLGAGTTHLVSRVTGLGAPGDEESRAPSVSADGTRIAFQSHATNLAADVPGSPIARVYVRSLSGGQSTELVSRRATGGAPAHGHSPSIDDSGNRVAFTSNEALGTGDVTGYPDVYLRDTAAQTTTLISRKSGPTGTSGNRDSYAPVISGNGRVVAFESQASNFASNDAITDRDIYWRVLAGDEPTFLASISDNGTKATGAKRPSINTDGTAVAFVASGNGLVAAADDKGAQAYVKRMAGEELELLTRADGDAGAVRSTAPRNVSLNGDGRTAAVALERATLTSDTDPGRPGIILRDGSLSPRRTVSVARPAGDAPFVNDGSYISETSSLSADGRYAAFVTSGRGHGVPAEHSAVAVRDRVTGALTLVSRADGPDGALFPGAFEPSISADGRRVAFTTYGADTNVWVRDIADGRTWLASRADGPDGVTGNGESREPQLDADGSRVAFTSTATNLSGDDPDTRADVYVRDLATSQTILASRADGAAGPKGSGYSENPALSGDGTRVAFATASSNLGDGDIDKKYDIHLRDLAAGVTVLVSATPGGEKGNGDSFAPSIDAAGARIAFNTDSDNLPDGDFLFAKVYVRDLDAGSLTLASRGDGAQGAAVGISGDVLISPDGGHVTFSTDAPLATGVTPGRPQVFVRDLASGGTQLVARTGAGAPPREPSWPAGISAGGGCVTFISRDLVAPRNEYQQLYLRALRADCDPGAAGPARPGPGPGGDGPSTTPNDTVAPALSAVRLSRKTFKAGAKSVLRFRSSEAASLTVSFELARPGKRAGAECKPVKQRPRRRGCVAYTRAGKLTRQIKAGDGRMMLAGKIGRKPMAAGRYRLTLVATDTARNRSKPVRLTMAIRKR